MSHITDRIRSYTKGIRGIAKPLSIGLVIAVSSIAIVQGAMVNQNNNQTTGTKQTTPGTDQTPIKKNNPVVTTEAQNNTQPKTPDTTTPSPRTTPTPQTVNPTDNSSSNPKPYVASVCTTTPIPHNMVIEGNPYLPANTTEVGYEGKDGYKKTCTPGSSGFGHEEMIPPSDGKIWVSTQPTSDEINACINYNRTTPGSAWYDMSEGEWGAYGYETVYASCNRPSLKYMD